MELFLVGFAAEGVILLTAKELKRREDEIIRRWKKGELTYTQIVRFREFLNVRKLNRSVRIGNDPGEEKKND